jgi:choline dehydrogenase-like flavoprotein
MICIIGSGLSAMAAATALVRRGCRPVIIDAGLTPDPSTRSLEHRLAAAEPDQWTPEDLKSASGTGPVSANGIPRKLYFGSDFTFQAAPGAAPIQPVNASVHRSFAAGGFSNVWGAVIQPLQSRDMEGWPIQRGELAQHYSAVQSLCDGSPAPLRPSSQASALYGDLIASQAELARHGIEFSYPQLAVRAQEAGGRGACRYCGLCLHGCPYDCRYNAAGTLQRLVSSGRVAYIPGRVVTRLCTRGNRIQIETRSSQDNSVETFTAARVFLAAGLAETTRIVLESLRLFETPVRIMHSDIFTLPLLRYRKVRGISKERIHTLCQLVAEVRDEQISAHRSHLQFYGFNHLYAELATRRAAWAAPAVAPLLRALAKRLFVIFGYLHSDDSSSITALLSGNSELRFKGETNPQAKRIARAIGWKLFGMRSRLQALPVVSRLRLDLPGGGYHSGGAFPMKEKPNAFQTDTLGRLPGLAGVHLVDASVLPRIPAAPLAFTVMANAHRIASECPLES